MIKINLRGVFSAVALEVRRLPTLYVFRRPAILALAGFACVLLVLEQSGRLSRPSPLDPVCFEGTPAAVVGVVVEAPDLRPSGCVYVVDTETLAPARERAVSVAGRMLFHVIGSTQTKAGPGDRVRVYGQIRAPEPARSPGAFDYRAYLATHGIHALVYASETSFECLGPSGGQRFDAAGWSLRRAVVATFERRLPPERAIVLAGLTVGQRPRFYPNVRRAFIDSGTMHVLVASGSNVGFILAGWLLLSALAGVPRRIALVSSLPAVWGYVLVVGGDAPIARAGAMATVAIAAYATAREDRPVHALAVAALARLATNPMSLFDVGFQMSFVTVLGLMHHLPAIEPRMSGRPAWARWPLRLLAASMIAHLWLLPISASVFHRVQTWGLAANLVIVPLSGLGLALGLAVAGLDALPHRFAFELLARAAAATASVYAGSLTGIAEWFSALGPAVWLPVPSMTGIFLFYAACLTAPHLARSWLARGSFLLSIALLAFNGWAAAPFVVRSWGVAWVDVGPRFAAAVIDKRRHAIVINPGPCSPADSSERTLAPFLAVARVRDIDAIVITDPRVEKSDVAALTRQMPAKRIIDATLTTSGTALAIGDFELRTLPASAGAGETPLLIERDGRSVLLGHRIDLETQGALLDRRSRLMALQGRFAPDAVWSPDLLRRQRPEVLVETAGESRESLPPWPSAKLARPHSAGWVWWECPLPLSENVDADKSRGKSAGVRPPRHAAHVASNRLRREGAQP